MPLKNADKRPTDHEELAELQAQKMITLYPSRYRVVENLV
jgi:hypothetical protein